MHLAVEVTHPGGTIVCLGVVNPDAEVSIRPYELFRRELKILDTYTNPLTMQRAIDLLASGVIDWRAIVTHQFLLTRFEDAWRLHQRSEGIKIGILPND